MPWLGFWVDMDDRTIQRKLNQIARLASELDVEAKKRYGKQAFLFMEPESGLHVMDGDEDTSARSFGDRTKHVRFQNTGHCPIEAGAW